MAKTTNRFRSIGINTIPGYRIQPLMPLGFPYLGITFHNAGFVDDKDGVWFVHANASIGAFETPLLLILTIAQAREADIVEEVK